MPCHTELLWLDFSFLTGRQPLWHSISLSNATCQPVWPLKLAKHQPQFVQFLFMSNKWYLYDTVMTLTAYLLQHSHHHFRKFQRKITLYTKTCTARMLYLLNELHMSSKIFHYLLVIKGKAYIAHFLPCYD